MINIHSLDGSHKVPQFLRKFLASQLLTYLFMTPCPVQKVLPLATAKVTPSSVIKQATGASSETKQPSHDKNPKFDVSMFSAKASKDVPSNLQKLANVVSVVSEVESSDNMMFLWKILAVFMDRILFLLNLVVMLIVLITYTNS